MKNKDNEKIELTPQQSDPGSARPEDFVVNEVLPFGGQYGDTPSERKRLLKKREENRPAWTGTPDRNDVNKAEKPVTGGSLK